MATDLFQVLADPTRRRLLQELAAGERAVGELVESLGVSQPTVSKHLRVLREGSLVSLRAQGQRRIYCLHPQALLPAKAWLAALVDGTFAAQAGEVAVEASPVASTAKPTAGADGSTAEVESVPAAAEADSAPTRERGSAPERGSAAIPDVLVAARLSTEGPQDEDAQAKRQHGAGRTTMEQVTERAQGLIDRLAKQRFGRRR